MTDKPAPARKTPESASATEDEPAEVVADGKPIAAKRGGFAVGAAAVGIGSAAVVAALLYVRHRKKGA